MIGVHPTHSTAMSQVTQSQETILREKIRNVRLTLEPSCDAGMMKILVKLEEKVVKAALEAELSFDSFTDDYVKGLHTGALMMIKAYTAIFDDLLAGK
jgi:hypothetical protein